MQVWMVSRHGTRYPSQEMIENLKKLHDFKTMITTESMLCPEDIATIRNWKFNLTSSFHYMLHRQGIEELKSLALRLKRLLPQIFNSTFDKNKYKVRILS
jgi:multiple inositol-polyphosphate phosphatase/2,3-bisphosphoglycerate 3-phosphatase